MYNPPHFAVDDIGPMLALINLSSFATLLTTEGDDVQVSHAPLILGDDEGEPYLIGHLAKANPQWKLFTGAQKATAIFHGPHAYISPSWYETQKSVPTWNYAAVHVTGSPRYIDNPEKTRFVVEKLSEYFEAGFDQPWTLDKAPADFIERQLKGIVAFEMPIEHIEGKFKLSQNRSDEDRAGVIKGLNETSDLAAYQLAQMMTQMGE